MRQPLAQRRRLSGEHPAEQLPQMLAVSCVSRQWIPPAVVVASLPSLIHKAAQKLQVQVLFSSNTHDLSESSYYFTDFEIQFEPESSGKSCTLRAVVGVAQAMLAFETHVGVCVPGDMESDVSVVSDATEDEVTSSGLLEGQPDAAHPSHHATRPFKHRCTSCPSRVFVTAFVYGMTTAQVASIEMNERQTVSGLANVWSISCYRYQYIGANQCFHTSTHALESVQYNATLDAASRIRSFKHMYDGWHLGMGFIHGLQVVFKAEKQQQCEVCRCMRGPGRGATAGATAVIG